MDQMNRLKEWTNTFKLVVNWLCIDRVPMPQQVSTPVFRVLCTLRWSIQSNHLDWERNAFSFSNMSGYRRTHFFPCSKCYPLASLEMILSSVSREHNSWYWILPSKFLSAICMKASSSSYDGIQTELDTFFFLDLSDLINFSIRCCKLE